MRVLALTLLVVALAGCGAPDEVVAQAPASSGPDVGWVEGVVVDGAVIPLAGVQVHVDDAGDTNGAGAVQTDGQGTFRIPLPVGDHVLRFALDAYLEAQTPVTVTAGQSSAPLRVQLLLAPDTTPRIEAFQWDGHLVCSFTAGTVFLTGCGLADQVGDHSRRFDWVDGRPSTVQSELNWEPTAISAPLCMRHYASSGVGGDVLGDVCGDPALTFVLEAEAVEASGIGNTRGLERVVWATSLAEAPVAGLAIDQPFTIYTHLFFNMDPAPGWTFLADGPHPIPS